MYNKPMNKDEIVMEIAKKANTTQVCARNVLSATIATIIEAVKNDEKVVLMNFGIFERQKRAPRTARNIKANKQIIIPERYIPIFTAGKGFKQKITENEKHILKCIEDEKERRQRNKLPLKERYKLK